MSSRIKLRVDLVSVGPFAWEARGGSLGTGRGPTVIGALDNLVASLRADAREAIDRDLEEIKRKEKGGAGLPQGDK